MKIQKSKEDKNSGKLVTHFIFKENGKRKKYPVYQDTIIARMLELMKGGRESWLKENRVEKK